MKQLNLSGSVFFLLTRFRDKTKLSYHNLYDNFQVKNQLKNFTTSSVRPLTFSGEHSKNITLQWYENRLIIHNFNTYVRSHDVTVSVREAILYLVSKNKVFVTNT